MSPASSVFPRLLRVFSQLTHQSTPLLLHSTARSAIWNFLNIHSMRHRAVHRSWLQCNTLYLNTNNIFSLIAHRMTGTSRRPSKALMQRTRPASYLRRQIRSLLRSDFYDARRSFYAFTVALPPLRTSTPSPPETHRAASGLTHRSSQPATPQPSLWPTGIETETPPWSQCIQYSTGVFQITDGVFSCS
jgi:hypothetical protein